MQEEQIRQAKLKIEQDMQSLHQEFGDVSSRPCTLEVGQSKSGLYLSTFQIDLLLLVNVKTPEELISFVKGCVQVYDYDLGEVTESNLEQKKREVFQAYKDSLISYKDLAPREGFSESDSVLMRIQANIKKNVPAEYYEAAMNALVHGGEKGLIAFLGTLPNGEVIISNISRYICRDYDGIKDISYEEILALDELIKRDPTIDSLTTVGAKYDMTMHYGLDGKKRFDPYFLDRALAYCRMTKKHMRFHSLFDRSTAMDFKKAGYSKEQVMMLLKGFADGYFEYLQQHSETLDDGSRIINVAEIFNELLTYEPGTPDGKKTGLVWYDYFGMTLEDLFSFIMQDGVSRVPDGVSVMYNETALEEGKERLQSCDEILRAICRMYPEFINIFGNQMHVYDSLFQEGNYDKLSASVDFMKHVQDDFHIKIQITEHDLNINGNLVSDCIKHGIPREYIRLLKARYQRMLSRALATGLDIESVDYWSIFDKADHNLIRDIEGRLRTGRDTSNIPSLSAGLLPEGGSIDQIPSLNPKAEAYIYQMSEIRKKKLGYPTEEGSIGIVILLTIVSFVLLLLIVFTLFIV